MLAALLTGDAVLLLLQGTLSCHTPIPSQQSTYSPFCLHQTNITWGAQHTGHTASIFASVLHTEHLQHLSSPEVHLYRLWREGRMLCCAAHGRHAGLACQARRQAGVPGCHCGRRSGSRHQAGGFRGSVAICLDLQGTEDMKKKN